MVEILLRGINAVLINSKADLRMGGATGDSLKECLESELGILFKLSHHQVLRIQLQVLKLLFHFVKTDSSLKFDLKLVSDESKDEKEAFKDKFYRSIYDLQLRVQATKKSG